MDSTLFTVGVACTTIGFVAGMLVKHFQDSKTIKELGDMAIDSLKKVMSKDNEVINAYMDETKRLVDRCNKLQIELNKYRMPTPLPRAIVDDKFYDVFNDVSQPLLEDWVDIDFPNTKKEDK